MRSQSRCDYPVAKCDDSAKSFKSDLPVVLALAVIECLVWNERWMLFSGVVTRRAKPPTVPQSLPCPNIVRISCKPLCKCHDLRRQNDV